MESDIKKKKEKNTEIDWKALDKHWADKYKEDYAPK